MQRESEYDRVFNELRSIEQAIEELTPLRSRWNGTLRLETIEGERGSKSFTCEITLRPDVASSPMRWRTLIHELLHACSVGFLIHDFNAMRGWEEGVVEQLARLFRRPILDKLGVQADWELLEALDRAHPFNRYIAALETIRMTMNTPETEFYLNLLQTPIRQRYASLVQTALRLEAAQRRNAIAALSAARPVLEGIAP